MFPDPLHPAVVHLPIALSLVVPLVATAARADRKSLGCADDRELTYFGEALFRDALPQSTDLLAALAGAREVIERHELDEGVAAGERSEPQLFVGERMRAKLAELRFAKP